MASSEKYFLQTISSGQQFSPGFFTGEDGIRGPMTMLVIAPTVAETCHIQVCGPLLNWVILQSGDTDITLLSNRAKQVMVVNATGIRISADSAVGADRIFEILWNVT